MEAGIKTARWRPAPATGAALAFLAGIALCVLLAMLHVREVKTEAQLRFDAVAVRVMAELKQRLRSYEYALGGARAVVSAVGADRINRRTFRQYIESRELEKEFPGARGFGLIRRVPQSEEAAFVATNRADGTPDFRIHGLGPNTGVRYVVQYVEPVERNAASVGLDIASEPNRREAAERAMRTGDAVLTAPITLVQASGQAKRSFLLLLPLYRTNLPTDTEGAREAATVGWMYAPLVIDEILADFDFANGEVALALKERGPNEEAFFSSIRTNSSAQHDISRLLVLSLYGREWEAELHASPMFIQRTAKFATGEIAAAGIAGSSLLAILVYNLLVSWERRKLYAGERARRAAIVGSSHDAIVGTDREGIVTDWNVGAVRLFGYGPNEALGRNFTSLLLPSASEQEGGGFIQRALEGESIEPFDTMHRHKDGSPIDVSVSAYPVRSARGELIGFATTVRDIRDRKAAEATILNNNERLEQLVRERTDQLERARRDLQNILDSVPSAIGYWDHAQRLRFANRAYCEWAGVGAEQLPSRSLAEVGGDEGTEWDRRVQAVLTGQPQRFERRILRQGSTVPRHTMTYCVPDMVNGQARGFYELVQDISEQVEDKAKLAAVIRENEALLSTLQSHGIFSAADAAGWITDVNEGFCRISGYTRQELIGKNHRVVNSGVHPPEFWRHMWRTISSGKPWRGQVCNRAKDGSLYWVDSLIAPFLGADGQVEKYISIRSDITAAKNAEVQLRSTTSLLMQVLESATEVSIIATDPAGLITVFNRGAEQLLGYTRDEMVGKGNLLRFHNIEQVQARAKDLSLGLGRTISEADVFFDESTLGEAVEWTYVRKDQSRRTVSLSVTAMRDEDGRLRGYLAVAHDITERKLQESSLRHAIRKAEQASVAKSHFLANMSHEIRTPMNAVIGLTYLLEQTRLDNEQQGIVRKVKVASKSLLSVINDVLDLSKIESGEFAIDLNPFDLHQVLSELQEMMEVPAREKEISLLFEYAPHLPRQVVGDAARLAQVLTNLLSNAIKFTEQGKVRLIVTYALDESGTAIFKFSVEDTGIGIAPDVQAKLFTPFTQADASTTRRFGGTGLGLSIVKRIVELLQGEVSLRSQLGLGSVFTVVLPMRILPAVGSAEPEARRALAMPHPDRNPLKGMHVLVVDDSDINLEVARGILERAGARVLLAADGETALLLLREASSTVDLVLMDVQMPGLDGIEVTHRIRGEMGLTHLPIVALTAGALVSERQRALAAGMNDFITKPFDPKGLVAIVHHLGPRREETASVSTTSPELAPGNDDEWPEIEGIDGRDVRQRLDGDVELFLRMLKRLLAEAEDIRIDEPVSATPDRLTAAKARMHRLRGGASLLGAKDLHRTATAAEGALGRGDVDRFVKLRRQLRSELDLLKRSSSQHLSPYTRRSLPSDIAAQLDREKVGRLIALLQASDLSALDLFARMRPDLRQALGREHFERLERELDDLSFSSATSLLATLRDAAPSAAASPSSGS
ncbi:PAS domain S-box protein [Aquabacterium sp. A7-Y]|uniref:PAS domain S-box protein n=1 Tax=Aquabacterium sp. A7-Y TaxID=1349605 RepID=UPI00223C9850|nr:PAS domain S-box protein [Aquabacterium sp. A7-Y]MCW7541449.1 PAS domain S-box protein [Aquabacterium sp. A7-Y]